MIKELPPTPQDLMDKATALFHYLDYGNEDLLHKLEEVYGYLDEFSTFISKYAACSKGCTYCCYYDVHITTFEAEYIYIKTGIPHNHNIPFTKNNEMPCPFLFKNWTCGIYKVRPVVCRMFHALGNPQNCKKGKKQIQYGSENSDFGNPIYKGLVLWVHYQSDYAGGKLKDIRNFFPYRNVFE